MVFASIKHIRFRAIVGLVTKKKELPNPEYFFKDFLVTLPTRAEDYFHYN